MRATMVKVHVWLRSRSNMSFLANARSDPPACLRCSSHENFCAASTTENSERVFMSSAREPLIKNLLRFRCLWFVSRGSLAPRVYIWSLPLVFVLRPCVRTLYLTSHLQNETIWDMNIWNTCEGFTLAFFSRKASSWPGVRIGYEKNLTSCRSVGKSTPI